MNIPVTLFPGQWADLPLEKVCQKAKSFCYDGLELAYWGDHFEVNKANDAYCRAKRWKPILDAYKKLGIRFGLEVHPTEIAFEIASARRALKVVNNHPAFGFNFDPSHFGYQGPLSVEWEDSSMDREVGAEEACEFVRRVDFPASDIASDAAFEKK